MLSRLRKLIGPSINQDRTARASSKDIVKDNSQWTTEEEFLARRYASYEEYVEHQKSKLAKIDLSTYHRQFLEALVARLSDLKIFNVGDSVLCLGARQGTECEAFIRLGCFAVGIDLNPGTGNRYVLHGDFHDLQFADKSVKAIYTNALDHTYDMRRVLKEISRVLSPDGIFIAEIVRGSKDPGGREPGAYESVWWDTSNRVIAKIEAAGFHLTHRREFTYPWGGDQTVFRLNRS